ncbi:MAG: hypothetical protein JEZ06_00235 [Anaerolineaceae bacterium]|nr:hypothetical protein [Anaerolineaceae bacterium]
MSKDWKGHEKRWVLTLYYNKVKATLAEGTMDISRASQRGNDKAPPTQGGTNSIAIEGDEINIQQGEKGAVQFLEDGRAMEEGDMSTIMQFREKLKRIKGLEARNAAWKDYMQGYQGLIARLKYENTIGAQELALWYRQDPSPQSSPQGEEVGRKVSAHAEKTRVQKEVAKQRKAAQEQFLAILNREEAISQFAESFNPSLEELKVVEALMYLRAERWAKNNPGKTAGD